MIRVSYVPSSVLTRTGLRECHYSAVDNWPYEANAWPVAEIPHASYSDYSGGVIERSNYRLLLNNAEIRPHLVFLFGNHGSRGLAYSALTGPVSECPALAEIVSGLEEYPALDDEDVSRLESELIDEAWCDYGRTDFVAFLADRGYDLDTDVQGVTKLLDQLWKRGSRKLPCELVEEGGGVFFDVGQWGRQALTDPKIVATLAPYAKP